jgi:hypothetical protein
MRYEQGTRHAALVLTLCFALIGVGCGSDGESTDAGQEAKQQAARESQRRVERRELRESRRQEARERRQAARRRARRQAARELARVEAREQRESEEAVEAEASECDPNYSGACLDPYASDYDCEGGSGDGPSYTGPVQVVGSDPYGLDADGDGYACE